MARVVVNLASGHELGFQVDKDREGPACFALSIRKCGSTVFNKIVVSMAQLNERRYVNVAGRYFRNNIAAKDWMQDPANCGLLYGGNIYGGFRFMPVGFTESPIYKAGKKILMVRDPRDAMVSEYFSNAYSHRIPERTTDSSDVSEHMEKMRSKALGMALDEYVVERSPALLSVFMGYVRELKSTPMRVVKYEDYIFKKPDLIRLIAMDFDLKVDHSQIDTILQATDIRPTEEIATRFIRKVTPGDHREKLQQATIEKLNQIFAPAMQAFSYSAS